MIRCFQFQCENENVSMIMDMLVILWFLYVTNNCRKSVDVAHLQD
jgi:hypothetical protein